MENNQFEEWLADYEKELREGVQKRFGLTDGIITGRRSLQSIANSLAGPGVATPISKGWWLRYSARFRAFGAN
jgi:hypothetical protein